MDPLATQKAHLQERLMPTRSGCFLLLSCACTCKKQDKTRSVLNSRAGISSTAADGCALSPSWHNLTPPSLSTDRRRVSTRALVVSFSCRLLPRFWRCPSLMSMLPSSTLREVAVLRSPLHRPCRRCAKRISSCRLFATRTETLGIQMRRKLFKALLRLLSACPNPSSTQMRAILVARAARAPRCNGLRDPTSDACVQE